ncbi:MAG TPA: NUDIX domain-containing protein, partial [Nitrososphaerales archaeon]|nr:NUDIX domain-containing protein [Nitrososphaerales archaeon]
MPGSELVDVVDKSDRVLETRTLDECLKLGLLHRAVTVFLRNSKGQMFLQQRSKEDDWLPGMWTASCTGHVKSGEDAEAAAARELDEELGIACSPIFLFKF